MTPRFCPTGWLLAALLFAFASGSAQAADYIGGGACRDCHATEFSKWQGSHHDLAMQPASETTVLGDFDNASLTHFGVTTNFFRKDDKFMVRTEGPDGKQQAYEIAFTFGVAPLQQYLVGFPDGRMQALSLAWDSRPENQGGQRWFHLYPDEQIAHDDELHWTRPGQNWNSRCAECHSTHLEKNYDPDTRTFATTWSDIDVACEACHGPGSDHVIWAGHKPGWEKFVDDKGLVVALDEREGVDWKIDPETGNPVRSEVLGSEREIEVCAPCHARRSPITSGYVHGEPLLDHYIPQRLEAGMYYPDGQIDDEVYVYGSFLQSKMYHAGVTCSDCHEPHSLTLRAPGNGVCLQCHQAQKYDRPEHHFHPQASAGASCAECHMPPKTYMVVDPRHDHSMRIPRPDQSLQFGTPNACNNCHADKDAVWADRQVKDWYGHVPDGYQSYAQGLYAARQGAASAGATLAGLVRDTDTPDIARATAIAAIRPYLSADTIDVLPLALSDPDPGVRTAAVGILEQTPLNFRVKLAFPMLEDPVRAVRIEAARVLAGAPPGELSATQRASLESALQEYVMSQQASAERPEAQTNLGNLYAKQENTELAVAAYQTAIDIEPAYIPAYVNLADLYRTLGKEKAA
ncbi:MAG TPA: multiheme c-type cytochrome, partial [Gammaproteobacteria bacterium]|nr:multiheme c-type cytochrome [Gammaproteobacteria bacterium]